MRSRSTARWSLPCAVGISLLLHAGAAAVIVGGGAGAGGPSKGRSPEPAEDQVRPGIDNGGPVSLTWIGFTEPSPHAAPIAEVDQAQVAPAPGQQFREALQAASTSAESAASEAVEAADRAADRVAAFLRAASERATIAAREQAAKEAARRAREASEARRTAEAGGNPDDPAMPDDREAAAASTTRQLVYTPGQPLARQGLRIQTVRPRFDAATRVLELRAVGKGPVVQMSFSKDGSVRNARIVQNATGRAAVDEPILTAVYRWRAAGSDLETLPDNDPDAVLSIVIHFDL